MSSKTPVKSKAAPAGKTTAATTKKPAGEQKMKLTYFEGRGRCEHIRYMFAVAKLPYEDIRVKSDDWSKLKPNTPCKSLPMLELEGKTFGQSLAVGRLVAKKTKLYGKTLAEETLVDEVVDSVNDIREESFGLAFFKGDDSAKEAKAKAFAEMLPKKLDYVTERLGKNKYILGESISWADIHFYTVMEIVVGSGQKDALAKYESLQKLYKRVEEHPQIADWRKKRPESQF